MANRNYLAGRRLEYDSIKRWEEQGYRALRTAGSHGEFDVIAYNSDHRPKFIQCKRVSTKTQAKALIKKFKETTVPSPFYHQVLEVKIKGHSEVISTII